MLCAHLSQILTERNIPNVVLSLDNFYLSKKRRLKLAASVHPLAGTRGVPGTHDTVLLTRVIETLRTKNQACGIPLPLFSKATDDLLPDDSWTVYSEKPRFIFLEGWCVGARSNFITNEPDTLWEKREDPDGVWKKWSRQESLKYEDIWNSLNFSVLLKQKNFNQVIESRWIQELNSFEKDGEMLFKSKHEIREFCAHYESWTIALWENLPDYANVTLNCETDYNYSWSKKSIRESDSD